MYAWLQLLETSTLHDMWEDIVMAYAPDAPDSEAADVLHAIENELLKRK